MYQNTSHDTKGSIVSPIAKFKFVFLGDTSVGKTSIINRFMFDTFDGKEHPTIGIDFISKTLNYDDRSLRLQLWDTAGQERFRSLIPSYIRDSAVAIIVYDITSSSSFENINKWIDDVKAERANEVIICLVGNKVDLSEKRVVATDMGLQKAKEKEALFMEVSAKSGHNINSLFKTIAMTLPGNDNSQFAGTGGNNKQQTEAQNIQLKDNDIPNATPKSSKCC